MDFHHIPVLLKETLDLLDCSPGKIIVDGTLGGGGHALEIIKRIVPNGMLIGIDRDTNALKATSIRLHEYVDNYRLFHDNYVNILSVLEQIGIESVDGVLMDLGVSSHQLDEIERGFGYQNDSPLDMRMDTTQDFSAYDVVNGYEMEKLTKIIKDYGEERWAKRIAQFIIDNRPVRTTSELVNVIKKAIPASARKDGPHPARRTFQAIRIEVNSELELLEKAVENAVSSLSGGGRLCIITFHSLEDRIVKNTFLRLNNPCTCPPKAPICICKKEPVIKILTRKPIVAETVELETNRRSRSAKLRACQKL